jgi:tetratricopeptide (TPR) repeat protein
MNIKDYPTEWQVFLEHDKDGNITGCNDLYVLFNRNPLYFAKISDKDRESIFSELVMNSDENISNIETKSEVLELSQKILNEEELRSKYNSLYKQFHGQKFAGYFIEKGNELSRFGHLELAIKKYEKAIILGKSDAQLVAKASSAKGKALESLGRLEDALLSYTVSLDKNPEQANVLVNVAKIYLHKKQYPISTGYFEKALVLENYSLKAANGAVESLTHENVSLEQQIRECLIQHKASCEEEKYRLMCYEMERGKSPSDIRVLELSKDEQMICGKIDKAISSGKYVDASAAVRVLFKISPESSEGYYYRARIKMAESKATESDDSLNLLKEVLKELEISIAKKPLNSTVWHKKKEVLEGILKLNEAKLQEYMQLQDYIRETNRGRDLEEKITDGHDPVDISDVPLPSVKDALKKEALGYLKSAADLLSTMKRNILVGYLPAEDQIRIAQEHGENAETYTNSSITSELAAAFGVGLLGFASMNVYLMYLAGSLTVDAAARGISAESASPGGKAAGSPLLAFHKYFKNWASSIQKKQQIDEAKRLDSDEAPKLLEAKLPVDLDIEDDEIDAEDEDKKDK